MNVQDFELPSEAQQRIEDIEDELAQLDDRRDDLLDELVQVVDRHDPPN
jgi:predicted nuclease with TOPRIM domain